MSETEGVIKYQLKHTFEPLKDSFPWREINAWRNILFKLNLIGQNPNRYEGYSFGNISESITKTSFIISGTQTGHLSHLTLSDYCLVRHASPKNNHIISSGESKPSSEALTHASVYAQDPQIKAVIHVHCPEIWHNTQALLLPFTNANIAYGTVEMAQSVAQLFKQERFQGYGIFTMLGHQDGVVAFGHSISQAADVLIRQFALSLALEET